MVAHCCKQMKFLYLSSRYLACVQLLSCWNFSCNPKLRSLKLHNNPKLLFCPRCWLLCGSFYSSLYLLSVNTTRYSRDGAMRVLNCSRFLPATTLRAATEKKVQFLFNQNFHKFLSANSGGHMHRKTMQMPLSTALCYVTMCPAVGKCQRGNLDSILCGALILSAHHNRLFLQCSFTNYI